MFSLLCMIQQMYQMWIVVLFLCSLGWGVGWGQVLQRNKTKPLISDSEKCASGEKKIYCITDFINDRNNNKNKNLTASLLLAPFEVSLRIKKQ